MEEIKIRVNGRDISLSEFPQEMIKNTITGMLKTLKGVEDIKKVEITMDLE